MSSRPISLRFRVLNFIATAGALLALFFLCTNGVPLTQFQGLPVQSKSFYGVLTRSFFITYGFFLVLCCTTETQQFKNFWIVRIVDKELSKNPIKFLLPLSLGFFFAFCFVAFARTKAFETRAFDLGIFAQAVWNTTQGNFLASSLKDGICLLGDHFSPILLLTVPFYHIWPDPRTLLLLQALATTINIFLIFHIAKEKTLHPGIAFLFALLYSIYRPTQSPLLEDFHPEVLAEPFMLYAFISLEKNRIIPFLICAAITATGKENMLGITFILGMYAAWFKKKPGLGTCVMLASVTLFFLELKWIMPTLSGKPYFYQSFFESETGLIKHLFRMDSLDYMMDIFGPFCFLSIVHLPTFILTTPILFQNLLSEGDTFRSLGYHYVAGLTPFVLVSSIYGFETIRSKISHPFRKSVFIAVFSFLFFLQLRPGFYFYLSETFSRFTFHKNNLHETLKKIPSHYSILTHNNLIPHVVNRKNLYQFDYNPNLKKVQQAKVLNADLVILYGDFWEPNTEPLEITVDKMLESGYGVEYQSDHFYILKLKTLPQNHPLRSAHD